GNTGKEVPRVLPDATGLVIVIAITLIVLQYIYHVEVPGLLAGSGVIAIIVGLAMQDLLGNLLAGVGLHFDKSFTPGDWLEIDGTHAKVIELSWRSTRLITNDDVMIDVPNSNIVKSTILNFEKPTRKHAVKPLIGLHYDIPPAQAQRVLQQAAATVPGVCSDPVPVVYLKEFADSAIIYEINVWIDDHGLMDPVMSDVRVNCWYACKRAGFEIPYPQLTLHRPAANLSTTHSFKTAAAEALRAHPVFNFLSESQVDELLGSGKVSLYGINEYIVTQGSEGASMFFIAQGRVEVFLTRTEERITVASLKAGDCFGEMSVLTGERRSATVVARDEVAAIEIPKAAFSRLIQTHPELLQRLTEVLATRQLSNEKVTLSTTTQSRLDAARSSVMQRLRVFFELNN
ncbi:MAG TPA: mechanosensitive ion channel family protein, partial [Opitutaceae bacterium]|nr:mechanosensitive ion channel family protein [Opitutaceae bacterium]